MSAGRSPHIVRGAPYFLVADVASTGAFYASVLGFTCEYSAGDPLEFALYSRDGHAIMLRRAPDPGLIRPIEAQGGTWDVFFWVDDVGSFHRELESGGAAIVYPPTVQPYGMKEFAIRDPGGYVLGFGQTWPPPQGAAG
jgi:catechol 2,3-dioxygenase-like lactoylglutathione lyase family enzyme